MAKGGRGGKRGAAGGGGTETTADFVFTPQNNDEVSEKINQASEIKLSRSTITLKDENGKTMGMVRGMERFTEMSGSKQFDVNNQLKKMGLDNLDTAEIGRDNIFTNGKQIYVFASPRLENLLTSQANKGIKVSDVFADELKKVRKKNEIYKKLETGGAIIIKK